ncbi:cytochrome c biogenesis protein CcsA [Amycolatopsis thermoflava]|uniref:cytochrome c biogenesis protein CcsA n=1 Tax=Amycolatopsis thermoflava TaxID=84480 RepID=UPI003807355E
MSLLGRRLPVVAGILLAAGLVGAVLAPPDRVQGEYQRLMYVHVPTAWVAYLCFALTGVLSGLWLWRRRDRFDRAAAASAELGVLFTGLTIVLGSWWGKPVWGVWWTWDPRLVTTALMFFVYLGYLALRRGTLDPALRARRSAVLGIVALVQVPIVHMSVVWWRALHQPPTVLKPGDPTIDHRMLVVLLVNLAAFTVVALMLLRARIRLSVLEEDLAASRVAEDRELAGGAVRAPRLEGR